MKKQPAKPLYKYLYFWVLTAIIIGGAIGYFAPDAGVALKPLGDIFIALIQMMIAPVVFCTIVLGIANTGDVGKAGRIGFRALVYFEIVSSFALLLGLLAGNILQPGAGFHADPKSLDAGAVSVYAKAATDQSFRGFVMGLIPHSFADALTGQGSLLQVILIAVLFGYALSRIAPRGKAALAVIEDASLVFFRIVAVIMKLAPLGAGGAMAFTVGKYGIGALKPLLSLVGIFYGTGFVFVFGVLGIVAKLVGVNIFKFVRYIREEILIVLGTSSSESVLAPLMQRLEQMGCPKDVVGLVVPAGYSFNLDGTNIYITLAVLFVAQALDIHLSWGQQATIFAVALATSKGASGVTGAGFITLAATLAVVPDVPVAGLALILGVDRFMSEARAIINTIGNGIATVVLASWEGTLDRKLVQKHLENDQ